TFLHINLFIYTYIYSQSCSNQHFAYFFFNITASTDIYTLSLHDALPILHTYIYTYIHTYIHTYIYTYIHALGTNCHLVKVGTTRSEEHTSELQSRRELVCRQLLEKKNSPLRPNGIRRVLSRSTSMQKYRA